MKETNKNPKLLIVKVAIAVLFAAVLGSLIFPNFPNLPVTLGWGLSLFILLGLLYTFLTRYFRNEGKRSSIYTNKYHDVFFKGTIVLAVLMVVLTLIYSFFIILEGGNLFSISGLILMVTWIAVFMIYFVWSVYHYNINYGLTDDEWERIFKEKTETIHFGIQSEESHYEEPTYNPYRSQTFGLPPGTVRGMIAFTLLIGGISLLISSMGNNEISPELIALRIQQFEFFETAFLMMIAFYFGDRSLKYFRERWKNPNAESTGTEGSDLPRNLNAQGEPKFDDVVSDDDRAFLREDASFSNDTDIRETQPTLPLTQMKNTLLESKPESTPVKETSGFVQIMDNINGKILNDEEIIEALEIEAEKNDLILSLPVVKAIISVESAGRGHLGNGNAKILFEGHKFWHWLAQSGKSPDELKELQKKNEDILYEKWTRQYYKGGTGEYDRINRAKLIDEKSAIYSASWGLFQVLGENLEHNIKSRKYVDALDFEEKQHEHEKYHFLDFLAFIKTKKFKGTPLIDFVSENKIIDQKYDWASFAHGYNGSGYKVNKYDEKLHAAFQKFKKQLK